MRKILALVAAVMLQLPLLAQHDTTDVIGTKAVRARQNPYLELKVMAGVENNGISSLKLLNFIQTDFLENSDKDELMSEVGDRLRFGYEQGFELSYYQPSFYSLGSYVKATGFSIYNRFINTGQLEKKLVELGLYGNKRFAGQTVDIGPGAAELWYYTGLKYSSEFTIDSLPFRFDVALMIGHAHTSYGLKEGSIYTEPDGAYLDLDLNYSYRESMTEGQSLSFQGFGASIGLSTEFELAKDHLLSVGVSELGIMNWRDGQILEADSNFRFEGITFDNIFDITDSLLTYNGDLYEDRFFTLESGEYTTITPFTAQVRYVYNIRKKWLKNLNAEIRYRHLAGYIPKTSVGALINFSDRHSIEPSLAYGGFNALTLGLGYNARVFKRWTWNLNISNLPAIAAPGWGTGTFVEMGLRFSVI